jgi:hypothetical protein
MVIVFFVLALLLWQKCHCDGQQSLPFSCFSLFRLLLLICVCERRNTTDWVLAQHIFDSLLPYSLDQPKLRCSFHGFGLLEICTSRESNSRVVYSFAHQMGDFIHRFGLCGLLNVLFWGGCICSLGPLWVVWMCVVKRLYTQHCGTMMSEKGFVCLSSSWVHSLEHQRVVENLKVWEWGGVNASGNLLKMARVASSFWEAFGAWSRGWHLTLGRQGESDHLRIRECWTRVFYLDARRIVRELKRVGEETWYQMQM